METYLITRVFKVILVKALNVEAYLTLIGLKLNKKTNQIAICLYSNLLYHTFSQSQFIYLGQIFTPFKILEKHYAKFFDNKIRKLTSKPAYI